MATEKRLIDANELKSQITRYHMSLTPRYISKLVDAEIGDVIDIIDEFPTVYAVEVVRCKNCKEKFEYSPNQFYCFLSGMPIDEDDFCSLGSKKEGEEA